MRKVLGVTGIRSEYDIMSSVFRAVENHPELSLELVVTGAHLSDLFGHTIDEIKEDRFTIADTVESLIVSDERSARVEGLAIQLQGLTRIISRVRPDFLLVLGDREEAMTTALAGAYMEIPVAHVGGGDRVIGNVDDQVRHAVSKLAHLHLVTNRESYQRLLRLGEQEFRVHDVGNPGLDRLLEVKNLRMSEVSSRLGFDIAEGEPFVMLIQHVLSSESDLGYEQMKVTLQSLRELGIKTVISYPNSDAGSQQVIRAIGEYEGETNFHIAKNIPRTEFVNLMRTTRCLVGNSSAGILEAPLLKLPVVNIGNRQTARLHAENVQFVPHEPGLIKAAIRRAVFDESYRNEVAACRNPYGDGHSSPRIADMLAAIPIDDKLLIKDITY